MRVLIVDDSRAMRMLVLRELRRAGFDSHDYQEASNGAEGLAAVKAAEPDFVLSDWNMPEMNGIDFLRALRAEGSQVKFGFVTTEGSAELRRDAIEAGALFVINKPFTTEMFKEKLGEFLG
jgi:two-component system, chemotaxis family, chemotaxis protein CheY